jgi:hypothetical protein
MGVDITIIPILMVLPLPLPQLFNVITKAIKHVRPMIRNALRIWQNYKIDD